MRRPYTDMPLQARYGVPGRFMGAVSFVCRTQEVGDHRRNSAVWCSRCRGIRGRHSWSTVVHLEVLTQRATHASPLPRYAPIRPVWRAGAFHGGRSPFAPAHDRRKSANSAVRCWRCWGSRCRGGRGRESWLTGVHLGGVDAKGDACVAPTQIGPYPPGLAYRGVSWAPFRSSAGPGGRRSSAEFCGLVFSVLGVAVSGWSRSTIVVDGGSPGGVDAKGDACVAPTQIGPYRPGMACRGVSMGMGLNDDCPLLPSLIPYFVVPVGNPGNRRRYWWKRFGVAGVIGFRRATHASPLHR